MIVVGGEALIDLLLLDGGAAESRPGGGPFNAARTVARLGAECTFLGALSVDPQGRQLRAVLEADGVRIPRGAEVRRPTGTAIARIDGSGSASYEFTIENSASLMTPSAAIADVLSGPVDMVHLGSLAAACDPAASRLERFVERVGPEPLLLVDPNCRPAILPDAGQHLRKIRPLLGRADVVKASREDLGFFFGDVAPSAATGAWLRSAMGLRPDGLLLVSDGGDGVHILGAEFYEHVPGVPVTVVDTVGAGDALGAAFLAFFAANDLGRESLGDRGALRSAVSAASEVASIVCTRIGADPPTVAELAGWTHRS